MRYACIEGVFERNMKKKKIMTAAWMICIGLLAGCGGKTADQNIAEGMEKIKRLDYGGALESFEAARGAGENERLLYRGMGLAYMGMTDYAQVI